MLDASPQHAARHAEAQLRDGGRGFEGEGEREGGGLRRRGSKGLGSAVRETFGVGLFDSVKSIRECTRVLNVHM